MFVSGTIGTFSVKSDISIQLTQALPIRFIDSIFSDMVFRVLSAWLGLSRLGLIFWLSRCFSRYVVVLDRSVYPSYCVDLSV